MTQRKQHDPNDPDVPDTRGFDEGQAKPRKERRKRKKSVHGSGSVFLRKDGRWVARFLVEETGKYKDLYARNEKEANEKLQQALYEQKQGRLATGPQQKLETYLNQWLDEVHKPTIELSSYVYYRGLLNNHILPAFGQLQMKKLTAQKLQSFYAKKLEEGYSANTIHSIHNLLHRALDNAVRWRLVAYNVCDDISALPKYTPPEIQPLTPEQAQQLRKAMQGHDLEPLVTLALISGLREGEITSLRWSDVNFTEGSLSIQRKVKLLGRYGYVEGHPKTAKSKRHILLPGFMLDMLKAHRTRQMEKRRKMGEKWQERDLVFSNRYGGFLNPNCLLERFRKLLEVAGLPRMRLHDLRHSAATILLSMGVHPKIVQELLGHSTISTTMDRYSHVLPSMQKEAMDQWNDLFRG